MGWQPFVRLKRIRRVDLDWLPGDLADFYSGNEPTAPGPDADYTVRLHRATELREAAEDELLSEDGWREFSGIEVGRSCFGDRIVYIQRCPVAPPRSIMVFGLDVAGPGGSGDETVDGSLVLDLDFKSWLKRLELDGWTEYGVAPAALRGVSPDRQRQLRRHFLTLNPEITWGK